MMVMMLAANGIGNKNTDVKNLVISVSENGRIENFA